VPSSTQPAEEDRHLLFSFAFTNHIRDLSTSEYEMDDFATANHDHDELAAILRDLGLTEEKLQSERDE
jgi:hypothetical protein